MRKFSRRSFLKSAGAATGAAVIASVPGVAAAASETVPVIVTATTPLPKEPLVAYIRDVDKAEVTILSGKHETTYRDQALVKRLLKAAQPHKTRKSWEVL